MEDPSLHPAFHGHGSVWPLVVAVAAAVSLVGVFLPAVGVLGLLLLVIAVVAWVREDAREWPATVAPGHRSDYWVGTLVFLFSEVVVFGTLFTYYFWVRGYATAWPPSEIPEAGLRLVAINTVLLVSSGFTAHAAHAALRRDRLVLYRRWLLLTILLGAAFVCGQAYEYATAGFGPTTGSYGTAFFALTGLHGLHVVGGLAVLLGLLVLAVRGKTRAAQASGVGGAVLYWHFVDAVWLLLFAVLYLRVV